MTRAINILAAITFVSLFSVTGVSFADKGQSNKQCPVGLVKDLELDQEFGPGTSASTKCLDRRHNVKMVVQINNFCRDSVSNPDCNRPYALGNIMNAIKDYEITHGMVAGKDFKIAAVVHSGGGHLMVQDGYAKAGNQFEVLVKQLQDKGVTFYLCQNTARSFMKKGLLPSGNATEALIPGVKYVTAGVTAIVDFQSKGYQMIQP